MLGPISSEFVLFPDFWASNSPRYLFFFLFTHLTLKLGTFKVKVADKGPNGNNSSMAIYILCVKELLTMVYIQWIDTRIKHLTFKLGTFKVKVTDKGPDGNNSWVFIYISCVKELLTMV